MREMQIGVSGAVAAVYCGERVVLLRLFRILIDSCKTQLANNSLLLMFELYCLCLYLSRRCSKAAELKMKYVEDC